MWRLISPSFSTSPSSYPRFRKGCRERASASIEMRPVPMGPESHRLAVVQTWGVGPPHSFGVKEVRGWGIV